MNTTLRPVNVHMAAFLNRLQFSALLLNYCHKKQVSGAKRRLREKLMSTLIR